MLHPLRPRAASYSELLLFLGLTAPLAGLDEGGPSDTVQTAFPGAPLYDRLAREGRLLAPDAWERCTLFDVSFAPVGVTVEELRAGLHRLTAALYAPDAVAERRARSRAARRGPAARG